MFVTTTRWTGTELSFVGGDTVAVRAAGAGPGQAPTLVTRYHSPSQVR